DSAKDAGLFPSAWALYRVQEDVARACADAGVSWTLFHGRGGTVGRGGGSPVARALTALPPGTVHGGIKITEQGEIVSQNFGLLSIAERRLELMLSGVLVHRFEDWRDALEPGEEARFRSEEHTSELQSRGHLVCRLLLEKKKIAAYLNSNCKRRR